MVKLDLVYKKPFLFILSKFPTLPPAYFDHPAYLILANIPTSPPHPPSCLLGAPLPIVILWEFFLPYLSLFRVKPEAQNI